MFNALKREIEIILGDEFAVFEGYNTKQADYDAILNEYKNVGVLYVNYGDIKLLPGNQGLTGEMQLELMMSVKDGVNLESVVSQPLHDLISKSNGRLEYDSDAQYNYVLNYHLPTSTGEIQITAAGVEYVTYSMPVEVTFAADSLVLGEQFEILINDTVLNGVVVATPNSKATLDTHTGVNDGTTKSFGIAKVWGMQIVCNFNATDDLHKTIYETLDKDPRTVWQIKYRPKVDGYSWSNRDVIIFDSTIPFERGQFAVMVLNLCEAD